MSVFLHTFIVFVLRLPPHHSLVQIQPPCVVPPPSASRHLRAPPYPAGPLVLPICGHEFRLGSILASPPRTFRLSTVLASPRLTAVGGHHLWILQYSHPFRDRHLPNRVHD